jgi:plasmid maintenance system killer protein
VVARDDGCYGLYSARFDLAGSHRPIFRGCQGSLGVRGNWRVVFRFEGTEAVDVDLIDDH